MLHKNFYTFIPPPRAEKQVPILLLPFYEKLGWWAQIKKNGTNSVISRLPDGSLHAWTREGDDHKAWAFSDASAAIFKRLTPGSHVINAELLHSKTPHIKDTHYIHDILVYEGKLLTGTTYAERYKILQALFLHNPIDSCLSHYTLDDHTWLARNIRDNFQIYYEGLTKPEDEGMVIKNPHAILRTTNDASWLVKIRRTHENYSF